MSFYCILRPKLCQIATVINSSQYYQRFCIPITCSIIQNNGNPVISQSQTRGYRKKIDVSHLKPLNFDYSEDLVKQEPLDPTDIVFKYKDIADIKHLPDHVKKLFTVEYATSQEIQEHRNAVLLDKVTDLVGPGPCLEKEICYLTTKIRNLIPYIVSDRRNKRHKSYLIERIAKRKKLLKNLRKLDFDRFFWLLKELKVTYTPEDPYRYYKESRKALIKREAREGMRDEKKQKIEAIRKKLEDEKKLFYEMKQNVLEEINKDIEEYGLDKVEVLKQFENHMRQKVKQSFEDRKKMTNIQKYAKTQKEKKEKESRVF